MALHQDEPLWAEAAGLEQMSPAVRVMGRHLVAEAAYRIITGVLGARGIDHLLLKGPHLGRWFTTRLGNGTMAIWMCWCARGNSRMR